MPASCTALTSALCSTSGLQHKERRLSRHEAQRLGHRGTAEDQAILEKVPGKHWPFGEWPEESKLSFAHARPVHVWAIRFVELWHVVSNECLIVAHIYYSYLSFQIYVIDSADKKRFEETGLVSLMCISGHEFALQRARKATLCHEI